ncbi:MAG: cyclic-di-AMP receptor [Oscillospiraceae bacterium]|nr:cyclic-di-AMP receptor [Oscillospiraceae bacterium]
MKLIFAIVNNDDSHSVSTALTQNGFQATKLASTGGFLMSGNTTFLLCADESRVDDIIKVIKEYSNKRKQFVPNAASLGGGGEGGGSSYNSFPVEVSVGGATIFVTNIERFDKV